MDNKSKVLLVQNPVEMLQGCIQCHLVEGHISSLHDWISGCHLFIENLGLQTPQGCYTIDVSEQG